MDLRVTLILILAVFLAFVIPLVIYMSMRGEKLNIQFDLFRWARNSRRGWKTEEDDLAKLSRMVAKLRDENLAPPGDASQPGDEEKKNENG